MMPRRGHSLLRISQLGKRCFGSHIPIGATCIFPDVLYVANAITQNEAEELMRDIDRRVAHKRYNASHFDSVIHDFKETEMSMGNWSEKNRSIIQRLFRLSLESCNLSASTPTLPPHVIDLKAKTGVIHPHVDSRKHGGQIVASLSLLSSRRLTLSVPPPEYQAGSRLDIAGNKVDFTFELPPNSLYILTNFARYDLAHDISSGDMRRVSIVFRDQPKDYTPDWAKDFTMAKTE